MKLPDISDADKMALIGRQTVLRRAKKDALQELRDVVVPMLNTGADTTAIRAQLLPLIEQVEAIDIALSELG
jgi:hypothetical protein